MIKTKSRAFKGVNSKKHPQNMRAGYYYNPALQNLQCLILGLTDLMLNLWAPKLNIAHLQERDFVLIIRYKVISLALSCYTPWWSLCDQTKPLREIKSSKQDPRVALCCSLLFI